MDGIENIFFDIKNPAENFKQLAERVKLHHVDKLVAFYRSLNYDIPQRKERIGTFSSRLEKRIADGVAKRLEELHKQFEDTVERSMKMLVATALTARFGLEFYGELTKIFLKKKGELLYDYNRQLIWVRGSGGTVNELDDADLSMV
jgi:hypothetical protein